jgi:hypothetical protein
MWDSAAGNFSLHHRVQTGSEAHPASYPLGIRVSFPGVKRPGREADNLPPSSAEVKVCVELYLHSPYTPSWRGGKTLSLILPYLKARQVKFLLVVTSVDGNNS